MFIRVSVGAVEVVIWSNNTDWRKMRIRCGKRRRGLGTRTEMSNVEILEDWCHSFQTLIAFLKT